MADICQIRTPVTTQSQLHATPDIEIHELQFVVRARVRNTQLSSGHTVTLARKRKCPIIERASEEVGQEHTTEPRPSR